MAFQDTIALFQARLSANLPAASVGENTVFYNYGTALLQSVDESSYTIDATAPNMTILGSSGAALVTKAADYGVSKMGGLQSTGTVLFTLDQAAQITYTIPSLTIVSTGGSLATSAAQSYTTQAQAVIPQGSLSSGTNQTETVTIVGGPSSGTFTLTSQGQTTSAIAFNATPAVVQTALVALSSVGTSTITGLPNVVVGGTVGAWTVTWQGAIGGFAFPAMTTTSSLAGGTSPAVSSAITAPLSGTPITALSAGTAGNVSVATITILTTVIAGVSVTNFLPTTGGTDGDTDASLKARAVANIHTKYGAASIQAAAIAAGAYDCWVYDPKDGSSKIAYAWCDQYGNTPGLSVGAPVIPTSGPVTTGTSVGLAPGSLADQVNQAVLGAIPIGVQVQLCVFSVNLYAGTAQIAVSVVVPAALIVPAPALSPVVPLVQNAVVSYIQSLIHGQVPTPFGLANYVQSATGYSLVNFTLNASTPSIPAAVPSLGAIYRVAQNAASSSLVSVTVTSS